MLKEDEYVGNALKEPPQSSIDTIGKKTITMPNGGQEEYFTSSVDEKTKQSTQILLTTAKAPEGCHYNFNSARLVEKVKKDPVSGTTVPRHSYTYISIIEIKAGLTCANSTMTDGVTLTVGAIPEMSMLTTLTQIYSVNIDAHPM